MTKPAYIVNAIRTPVVKANGVFKNVRADDLLSFVLNQIMKESSSIDPSAIGDVIVGCAMPEGEQGLNIARTASLLAGFPVNVPGVTINRFCSSGLQAVSMAADRIRLGEADIMIAAGVESMSSIPMVGHMPSFNPRIFSDEQLGIAFGMGTTAEQVASQFKVSRESQDAFAFQSHQKAMQAQQNNLFNDEIRAYEVTRRGFNAATGKSETTNQIIKQDNGPRSDTSVEKLNKLRTVFDAKGSVTAGNSSQMSDGASAVLLCSEAALKKYNLTPMAQFHGFSVAGVAPEVMGIGPIEAIPKVLAQTNIKLQDVGHIELNEAFAAQSLAIINELNLNPEVVNPLGGAIALGHPLGATGAIRTATLLHNMQRNNIRYGIVSMCVGTGMGAAGLFEKL